MATTRDAIDTIKGYYYQFDYTILKIIESNDNSTITIEGIEDVDISSTDEESAIQCKYYAGTEYNHSVIGKPIRLMLEHFARHRDSKLKYMIYGFYSKGQDKMPKEVTIDFAKKHFFTTKTKGEKKELHKILKLTDDDLGLFIEKLSIDINALSFEKQNEKILLCLSDYFSCSKIEAEHYYNNSLRIIRRLSIQPLKENRTITKSQFLKHINNKSDLFNLWYLGVRGVEDYCKNIKKLYFTRTNLSPFSRVFLVECNQVATETEIKSLVIRISERMSKLSKRATTPFCPYVYLHGISEERLKNIKHSLRNDNFKFLDGHDFKGATFHTESILKEPNFENKIRVKIVNKLDNLTEILDSLNNTREIYQFYIKEPYYENDNYKHVVIPVKSINNIEKII